MKTYTYRIIIEPDEEDTFHAYVPALPGCHTWGATFEEAREHVRDAMKAYVKSLIADNEAIPEDNGVEVIEAITFAEGAKSPSHA